jgi:hypothetical protein
VLGGVQQLARRCLLQPELEEPRPAREVRRGEVFRRATRVNGSTIA